MHCLVTGATGFIGSALCAALADACVGVTRCGRESPTETQLAQVDVLFHCAGIAHRSASERDYQSVNHESTLALSSRAAASGVRRFIFLSSVNAAQEHDAYGRWKQRTETALRDTHASGAMSVINVRPALVYGKGAKGNLARLIKLVRSGMPAPPDIGRRSMVGLDDLCRLLQMLVTEDTGHGSTLVVTDGEPYSLARLHCAIRQALGKRAGSARAPTWLWRLACDAQDLLRAHPGSGEAWRQLFGDAEFSNQSSRDALPWQPHDTFETCVTAMLREAAS